MSQTTQTSANQNQTAHGGALSFETITVDHTDCVGIITLNRPKSLNALNAQLAEEVLSALKTFDATDSIGAIVITGSERAFAAGADIEEMSDKSYVDMQTHDLFAAWDQVRFIRKPIIAAVSGYALGGGCELAMLCDVIYASETAQFGQPEIKLGIIPGIGGTQRLTRAVGKAMAMDMILTGRMVSAQEALAAGLVARVVPTEQLQETALAAATTMAKLNAPAVAAAKAAVNMAFETTLTTGVVQERQIFQGLFATEGQKEGMAAFLEKRTPTFNNR